MALFVRGDGAKGVGSIVAGDNSGMAFPTDERAVLLGVKGVGPTVIARLEQIGIHSLGALAEGDVQAICAAASAIVGSTCWKNSPQARAAITSAIEAAKQHRG